MAHANARLTPAGRLTLVPLPRPLRLAPSGGPRSPIGLTLVAAALTCITARRWTVGQRFPSSRGTSR
jgi:hypothetical protein